jgi:hypothetical protein
MGDYEKYPSYIANHLDFWGSFEKVMNFSDRVNKMKEDESYEKIYNEEMNKHHEELNKLKSKRDIRLI